MQNTIVHNIPVLQYTSFIACDNGDTHFCTTIEKFTKDMRQLLDEGFVSVSLYDAYLYSRGEIQLPDKTFCLIFKGGYENNYTQAFAVLKQLSIKASIFVATDLIGVFEYPGVENYSPHFDWKQAQEMIDSELVSIYPLWHPFDNGRELKEEIQKKISLLNENLIGNDASFAFAYNECDIASLSLLNENGVKLNITDCFHISLSTLAKGAFPAIYVDHTSNVLEVIEQYNMLLEDAIDKDESNSRDFFEGSPTEQLACLNRAVEYVQLSEELETRFMAAVKRMKQAFNLCSSSEKISDEEKDYIHFYCAVRSILFKLTKGDAPDISQMNARVREMLEGAIQSDGIEELFETGKHISVDIFSDEYMDKINAIQLPNTKIKILQRLLSQAIDEFKKVNKIMGVEFADRLKRVVAEYNNRRKDESYANEVLDDIAEKLADLLAELKTEKDSFKKLGIDYEEKAFYDILKAVAKKYEFDNEYPDEKMIELSKKIKVIVDDKSRYTDWSTRDDIKANLQVDLILLLDEYGYPPVTLDDVYKEVLEQAENFKKYAG